jgi:hypothetical protein
VENKKCFDTVDARCKHEKKNEKTVNVRFLIPNFTFRIEIINENAQAIQNFCKTYQPIPGKF